MINLFVKVFLNNKVYAGLCMWPFRKLVMRFAKEKENKPLINFLVTLVRGSFDQLLKIEKSLQKDTGVKQKRDPSKTRKKKKKKGDNEE